MPILRNIGQLVTCEDLHTQDTLPPQRGAAIAWEDGKIKWVGEDSSIPAEFSNHEEHDADGQLVVPGLIDCHTHLAFGGWRADEFARRIRGESYLQIAREGGGIKSTVRKTRAASTTSLLERCQHFLDDIQRLGVTTIECKSGYGLSVDEEIKLLNVYSELREHRAIRIISTFLGAHVVPDEFAGDPDGYVDLVINEMLPIVSRDNLASFCDVFVEEGAFTVERSRKILLAGKQHGMRPKLHADQLSDGGGAALAADVGAVSADHLEHTSIAGMRAMADAGVVAVALPLASLYLNEKPFNGRKFIENGVRVAVATDFNPGSAPSYHLPLAMTLACTMNRLTPGETLKGVTLFAAHALGLSRSIGSIEVGKQADFTIVAADSVDHWMYHFTPNHVSASFVNGAPLSRLQP